MGILVSYGLGHLPLPGDSASLSKLGARIGREGRAFWRNKLTMYVFDWAMHQLSTRGNSRRNLRSEFWRLQPKVGSQTTHFSKAQQNPEWQPCWCQDILLLWFKDRGKGTNPKSAHFCGWMPGLRCSEPERCSWPRFFFCNGPVNFNMEPQRKWLVGMNAHLNMMSAKRSRKIHTHMNHSVCPSRSAFPEPLKSPENQQGEQQSTSDTRSDTFASM